MRRRSQERPVVPMSTRPPNPSLSREQMNNWLSAASTAGSGSRSPNLAGDESNAPDFEAIPRDKTGGRAAAVLSLYEADLTNRPAAQCIDWVTSEMRLNRKLRQFAYSIATEVEDRRPELDRQLNGYSRRSPMSETLPVVRNILRIALAEMDLFPKTSTAVIISEAVKLSQMFDTQGSGRYVNGVLGALVRDGARD